MRSYLDELALGACWVPGQAVAMTWGYYDESGEYDSAGNLINMTIGGCIASLTKWQAFTAQWQDVLGKEGLSAFHMTDFEAWKPPFNFTQADGSRDHERHKRLLNNLLEVVLGHVEGFFGFAAHTISADKSRAHNLAIEDGVSLAIQHAVMDCFEYYGAKPVSLVFARQSHFSAVQIAEFAEIYDFGAAKGRLETVLVLNADDVPALQAADIVAYELGRLQRPGRSFRYPLKRIVEGALLRGLRINLTPGAQRALRERLS